jgi:hypothetical protein
VAGAGEATGAVASTGVVLPVMALALGVIGGVSMLPGNPVRLPDRHATTWVFVAIVELLTAALVVLIVLGVLDWLLTGTLYTTDVLAPFLVAFSDRARRRRRGCVLPQPSRGSALAG